MRETKAKLYRRPCYVRPLSMFVVLGILIPSATFLSWKKFSGELPASSSVTIPVNQASVVCWGFWIGHYFLSVVSVNDFNDIGPFLTPELDAHTTWNLITSPRKLIILNVPFFHVLFQYGQPAVCRAHYGEAKPRNRGRTLFARATALLRKLIPLSIAFLKPNILGFLFTTKNSPN